MVLLVPYLLIVSFKPTIILNPLGYSSALYSSDGKLLRLTLSPDEKYRLFLPLNDISPAVVRATLEKEDAYFFTHQGINPISLIRGAFRTFLTGRAVGGSTITMQVARLRFDLRTRSFLGKLQQIVAALILEVSFSKEQILETYLNLAPYGGNVEGIGTASIIYFNQPASAISIPQASLLVAIPKNPSVRGKVFNARSTSSSGTIEILAHDLVTADANRTLAKLLPPDQKNSATILPKKPLPFLAPHFVNRILTQMPQPGSVRTTLDAPLQQTLESFLSTFIDRNRSKGVRNGSVLLIDYTSMEVKGYVGSADFFDTAIAGQVNGLIAKRSPGSSLKPFIYALAAEKGYIHSQTVLFDTAVNKSNYNPENFEKNFIGPISATQALIHSRNIPAITLLNQIGPQFFRDFLIRAGVAKVREPSFYGLSLALGGVEVSAEELARLYAMLASGGILKPLCFFSEDRSGSAISNKDATEIQLVSSDAAALILRMLSENPPPESLTKDIAMPSIPVPWKTGTSFGFRDAWATAVVGKYVLIVWLGNFDGSGNPIFVGRSLAGQLLFSIIDGMRTVTDRQPPWMMRETEIKHVEVCATSGMLPEPFCPHRSSAIYIPGVSPIKKCTVHRQVLDNGKLRVTEVWNSDVLKLFSDSGMPRRMEENQNNSKTTPPLITSPQNSLTYILSATQETVPLRAVTDGQSHSHTWFVNDEPVAVLPSGETYFWPAKEGVFVARVVDEQGKGNAVRFTVERR